MYRKTITNTFLIIALSAVQLSFISSLPGYLNDLNLILVVLVFVLGLGGLNQALWWAVGAGVLLDIFSFYPFGVFLIGLSLSVMAVNLLLTNFFTNRSLYSFFGLTIFFTLFYNLILNTFFYFLSPVGAETALFVFDVKFWTNLFARVAVNMAAALIVFYIVNFAGNKLKPAFLEKQGIKNQRPKISV